MKTLILATLFGAVSLCNIAAAEPEAPDSDRIIHEMRRHDPHPYISPEVKAQKLTEQMDSLLGLDKKQFKKLYKLNLKEARRQAENPMGSAPSNMAPPPRQGHPGGGGRPPRGNGMAPGGPSDMPPHGFGGGPDGPRPDNAPTPEEIEKLQKEEAKQREKTDKQIRKILTAEQYERWQNSRHNDPIPPRHQIQSREM